jgi:putative ABC transport system substrate-binding protein
VTRPRRWRAALAAALALGFLAAPLAAEAQPPRKVPRIGFLWMGSPSEDALDAFRQGLREADYIEGHNIAIEHRSAADAVQRLPELAAELVRSGVDIVVTQGTPAAHAAKRATSKIPIVMAISSDPAGRGLVASLARPGGNITGLTLMPLGGKRLEMLREAVPNAARFAVIVDSTNAEPGGAPLGLKETEVAARSLGLPLHVSEVRGSTDLEKAFKDAARARADALIVPASPILRFHRKSLVDLAAKYRLPTMYQMTEFAEAGGLMAYGPRDADLFRRAAFYVDRILKGAKPADLPVEQPTKFEFVINMKTAKALGLTIPPSLLLRADRVID